jgi:hypothetical protein
MVSATSKLEPCRCSSVAAFHFSREFLYVGGLPSPDTVMPAKSTRTLTNSKIPKKDGDKARFEAWLHDFDARQADLTARLDAFLHSLGVEPGRHSERESA